MKNKINDSVAEDVISEFDGNENYVVDARNNITRDEYDSFFTPCCDTNKIPTSKRCPVNNRCNKYGDDVDNTSLTRRFEEFANIASGRTKDGVNRTIEPNQKELREARNARSKNAETRSTTTKSKKAQ